MFIPTYCDDHEKVVSSGLETLTASKQEMSFSDLKESYLRSKNNIIEDEEEVQKFTSTDDSIVYGSDHQRLHPSFVADTMSEMRAHDLARHFHSVDPNVRKKSRFMVSMHD